MEIESKDVVGISGRDLVPTFTERTIKGTARVQNNRTLLLASVAQNMESNGRSGLPLLGLIPILGRLFTAPTRDNRQVDIVIAVTPRVIRAPSILPEDEIERPTGSLATPTSGSLEAMIIQEEKEELLASARKVPNAAQVQLPDQKVDAPVYVKSSDAQSNAAVVPASGSPSAAASVQTPPIAGLRAIDSSVKTLQVNQTSDTSVARTAFAERPTPAEPTVRSVSPAVEVKLPAVPAMKAGERTRIAVAVNAGAPFRSAVLGLRFDPAKVAVRSVAYGDVFGTTVANTAAPPFLNQNGKMFVSLSVANGEAPAATGTLAFVEIEALADGVPEILLEKDVLNFLTADGKNFSVKF
jgi:general secretion pathway protein D